MNIDYKNKIPGIKGGYMGMNKSAAKIKGLPWNHKKPTIEVLKNLKKPVRIDTEHHERFEDWRDKNLIKKGVPSQLAQHISHIEAGKFEKEHKPFNVKRAIKFVKEKGWK